MATRAYSAFYKSFSSLLISNQRQIHLVDEYQGTKTCKKLGSWALLLVPQLLNQQESTISKIGKVISQKGVFIVFLVKHPTLKKHNCTKNRRIFYLTLHLRKKRTSHSNTWFCNWNGHEAFNICFILFKHVKTLLNLWCLVTATAQVQKQRGF